jgi:two-component system nitrate/nitrite response regulator NarL
VNSNIRIGVVDDHPLYREGVVHTLASQEDMVIVGEGSTADDAVSLAANFAPDVLLLDLNLEGDALAAAHAIATQHSSVNVLMLTVVADEQCVISAMRLGARGYILKGVGGQELTDAVRLVSRRELYVSPCLESLLVRGLFSGPTVDTIDLNPFGSLSARELQIVALVSQAFSNKEIAWRLKLSEKTVKHYVTSVLKKLHVRNRVEAALLVSQRPSPQAPAYRAEEQASFYSPRPHA